MKRVFAAAVFGGLLTFVVPQASLADHGDHKGDCASQPAGSAEPEQSAPGGRSQYDREQKESDGGEILF